ncbi:SDR family oxidoreductase [Aeromicrobium phragmitis]|uniref:SDR family oxidoreductase n=1 Tax=Aeromicrobium phragmitis TaxID=2478914 RepID=A0A3L8PNZ0_9ACTN|nr:SDR family oxidoreductase [Aeromicrobium phragmitis]RLV57135.1 SDR family oxidoreductase [Aeromicrobium phragmitis]
MSDHKNRVVLVTGGAAGIGHACATAFAEAEARVHVLDRAEPEQPVPGVRYHRADLRDQQSVDAAVEQIEAAEGRLDVLVNNAGVSFVGGVEDGSEDQWHALWDLNVLGYVRATRAALPLLRRSEAAAIVNMSSCTAASGFRERALYSATKGAIESMTRSMAADLVAEDICVNAVNPGTVDTPFMAELASRADDPEQRRREFDERQPTGRMVRPREVALAALYLAHPAMRSSIGTVVTVDGGIAALHLTRA